MGRALIATLIFAGCGFGGSSETPDGGVDGSMMPMTCGDGIVQSELGELCDPNASGDGQCPVTCTGANVCSRGTLVGQACTTQCTQEVITEPAPGDGCCPSGANSMTDSDCVGVCGNGVLESGEVCDSGIASGAGACPTSCDDGVACTTNVLLGADCSRSCDFPAITTAMNGDSCCPGGANANVDNDCNPQCGNGVVETGEACDGNCPTDCIDGNLCTQDSLEGAACSRQCVNEVITNPANGDQCCPANANANNDDDCDPVCGNGVIEMPEVCDGQCPTTCADTNPCTTDVLQSPGTCQASCRHIEITNNIDNDGCCPPGGNPGQDNDC